MHEAIRQVDTKKIIFFEGITWDNWKVGFKNVPGTSSVLICSLQAWTHTKTDQPCPTTITFRIRVPRIALIFHRLPNVLGLKSTIKKRIRDAKRLNAGLFLTEFDVNVMTVMKRPAKPSKILGYLEACDELLQSWIGWYLPSLLSLTISSQELQTLGRYYRAW